MKLVDLSYDLILDYLYQYNKNAHIDEDDIRDFIFNDVLQDEFKDYNPTEEEIKDVFKALKKNGWRVIKD